MTLVNGSQICQLGCRKTISTRRRTWCIQRQCGCCAARAADADLDLDGPRASLLSVLVFAGPQPVTKLAELEQVSAPAITKMVNALESAGLAQRSAQKLTGASYVCRQRRMESACWSEAGRPECERSPPCLPTPPKRSCRPCARPRRLCGPAHAGPLVIARSTTTAMSHERSLQCAGQSKRVD